jgi:hypothetical protein
MGSRIYDKELRCGCLLSKDGSGGLIPCYAEYGNMDNPDDVKSLDIHNRCWAKFEKSKEYKEYFPILIEDEDVAGVEDDE